MRRAGSVTLVAAVALLFASSVARTDQGSHHRKDSEHGHGGHDAAPAQAEGLAGAWRALEAARDAIAAAVEALMEGAAREAQLAALAGVREQLGEGGAADRAAAIAEEMLETARP